MATGLLLTGQARFSLGTSKRLQCRNCGPWPQSNRGPWSSFPGSPYAC